MKAVMSKVDAVANECKEIRSLENNNNEKLKQMAAHLLKVDGDLAQFRIDYGCKDKKIDELHQRVCVEGTFKHCPVIFSKNELLK